MPPPPSSIADQLTAADIKTEVLLAERANLRRLYTGSLDTQPYSTQVEVYRKLEVKHGEVLQKIAFRKVLQDELTATPSGPAFSQNLEGRKASEVEGEEPSEETSAEIKRKPEGNSQVVRAPKEKKMTFSFIEVSH